MYTKGKRKGTIRFSIMPAAGAREVSLAGSFNDWKPAPMKKQKDGRFALDVKLAAGACEYKFLVDGAWVVDPDHNNQAPNPHGSYNSAAKIE